MLKVGVMPLTSCNYVARFHCMHCTRMTTKKKRILMSAIGASMFAALQNSDRRQVVLLCKTLCQCLTHLGFVLLASCASHRMLHELSHSAFSSLVNS